MCGYAQVEERQMIINHIFILIASDLNIATNELLKKTPMLSDYLINIRML